MTIYNMLSTVLSCTTLGLEGVTIRVEVDVAERGFPTLTIVGLPTKAVEESKERVRTAIKNAGFEFPDSKIVVNLAPADIKKEGSLFDLPIAVGILVASRALTQVQVEGKMFVGELSLDGTIVSVNGVLPICLHARNTGVKSLFVPVVNESEAKLLAGIDIYGAHNLTELVGYLRGETTLVPLVPFDLAKMSIGASYESDLVQIRGQERAKRALEVASAGFHNIHMKGVPGSGKTMMARTIPTILPSMDEDEILEVTKIYSVMGMTGNLGVKLTRPFRSPHQTISQVGLIGGSTSLTPGEITLAHRGVLFLDEFPQFAHSLIEGLRAPLEDGKVTVTRASGTVNYPARFLLVAASNPCPCGYLGHPKKSCKCGIGAILKYQKRLSGPILDRIDLHLSIPPVTDEKLTSEPTGEDSATVRERVEKCRNVQRKRFEGCKTKTNSEMTTTQIKEFCQMEPEAESLLKTAVSRLTLSARSYFKVIKVARTIADLDKSDIIKVAHIAESLQYRVQEE